MDAVYQMAHLCTLSNDSDAIVWRQMLPEHLRSQSASPHMQSPSSPFARPTSDPNTHYKSYIDDITRLKADIKQFESRLKEKDHELRSISLQTKALEESNSLRGEMLTMTKTAAQELQMKHSILVEEHRKLQVARQELEQSREAAEVSLQAEKAQVEVLRASTTQYQARIEKTDVKWKTKMETREKQLYEHISELEVKHRDDLAKMRADLSRSQNDSTDRNTIKELKAAHRHEVAGLNAQLARLHRERDKIIKDWHQLQEDEHQTRDRHELILARLKNEHALSEANLQVRLEHDHQMKLSKVQKEHEQTVQEMLAQFSAREAQQASSTGVSRAAAPSPERGQTLTPGQRLRQEHEQKYSNIHGKPPPGMSDEYWETEAKLREMLQSGLPDQKPKGKTTFFEKLPL
jgi:chromosome segregation ATPase